MAEYNLIDAPWIPCRLQDGKTVELGLAETLARAHQIAEVRDNSPLVTASLHRLLLALLHRALDGPGDDDRWGELWSEGAFDRDRLIGYFRQWHHRFDLFDPERPFMQVAGFAIVDGAGRPKEPAGVGLLIHEAASGNNPTLFDHTLDGDAIRIEPSHAARLLCALQTYAVGGGKGATSNLFGEHPYLAHGAGLKGITALLTGSTLFETLMLNLLTRDTWPVVSTGTDTPAWERESGPRPGDRAPAGYIDYLTMLPRIVRLITAEVEVGTAVTGLYLAQGESLPDGFELSDPFMPRRQTEEQGLQPIKMREDRAVWRDSEGLFAHALESESRADPRPQTFLQAMRLVDRGLIDEDRLLTVSVFGVASDKAKLLLWRHDQFPAPLKLVAGEHAAARLVQGIRFCEEAGNEIRKALWQLACHVLFLKDPGKVKGKEAEAAWKVADRSGYWSRMEGPFSGFLLDLGRDPELAFEGWTRTCLKTAREAFDEAARNLIGSSARDLKQKVRVKRWFAARLSQLTGQEVPDAPV